MFNDRREPLSEKQRTLLLFLTIRILFATLVAVDEQISHNSSYRTLELLESFKSGVRFFPQKCKMVSLITRDFFHPSKKINNNLPGCTGWFFTENTKFMKVDSSLWLGLWGHAMQTIIDTGVNIFESSVNKPDKMIHYLGCRLAQKLKAHFLKLHLPNKISWPHENL